MKKKIKTWLALVMTLVLALALVVPTLAADSSEDEYTVVATADEILGAFDTGATKIRLGNDIEFSGFFLVPCRDITLDLNGHKLAAVDSENAHAVIYFRSEYPVLLTICNGTVEWSGDEGAAIMRETGAAMLTLDSVTVSGGIVNFGTVGPIKVGEGSSVDRISGGTIQGDSSTGDEAIACHGTIGTIQNCTVAYDDPAGGGTGALRVGGVFDVWTGHVGTIYNCTFTGSGDRVSGIALFSGTIDEINNCTITGTEDRFSLVNCGSIGAITVGEGNTIESIGGGGTIGSSEVEYGIMNYGTIGSIQNCTITGLYDSVCTHGTIDSIIGNTLTAAGEYGIGIEVVAPGSIQTLSENHSTSMQAFIIVHKDAAVGQITNNTANAKISNGGLQGAGTVELISGNTIIAPESDDAIYNGGSLTTLGDNDLTAKEGGVGIYNEGTIQTISVPVSVSNETLFTAEAGWTLLNKGTVTNYTLIQNPDPVTYEIKFARQIRLYDPWGVRVSARIVDSNGVVLTPDDIETVGIYFYQAADGETVTSSEQLMTKGNYIGSAYNENLSEARGYTYFSSDYTGVATNKLDATIYYMGCAELTNGETVSSDVREMSLFDLLTTAADDSAGGYSAEEKAVYQAILNWFDAYQVYLGTLEG